MFKQIHKISNEKEHLKKVIKINFFYNELLQKTSWLIDGINLNNYVFLLCGVYIFILFLKLLKMSNSLNRKEEKLIQENFSLPFSLGSSYHLPSDFASSAKATNRDY